MTDAELARQLRQHLDSLARAGVAWLPRGAGMLSRGEPEMAKLPLSPFTQGGRAGVRGSSGGEPAPSPQPLSPEYGGEGRMPSAPSPQALKGAEGLATPAPTARSSSLIEQRRTELAVLAQEVAGCTRCPELVKSRTQTVFGVGQPGVELCFVGEAPGADEDAQGEPFVGAAGQLLNRIIGACGLQREEVYICNTLKCRPPNNRTPLPDEIGNCRGYLERQLELVQPKFICALGTSAAQSLLQTGESMSRLRRRFHDYRGIPVLCTYHPAYLLPHRAPEKKKDVWEDMKMLLERMGRPIPSKS